MCPYHVASASEGGMGYTAASLGNFKTACFTDWVGNGFQSTKSPIFQQLFENFKAQLYGIFFGFALLFGQNSLIVRNALFAHACCCWREASTQCDVISVVTGVHG